MPYKIHVNILNDQLSCLKQRATDQQTNNKQPSCRYIKVDSHSAKANSKAIVIIKVLIMLMPYTHSVAVNIKAFFFVFAQCEWPLKVGHQ